MRTPRVRTRFTRLARGLICGLLVLGHAVATFGYPVLAPSKSSAGAAHACGCPEEVQARHACCCSAPQPGGQLPDCCARHAKRSCCAKATDGDSPEAAGADDRTFRWVNGFTAQRCRGETPSGLLAAEPVIVTVASAVPLPADPPAGIARIHSDSATSIPAAPPAPPPRLR